MLNFIDISHWQDDIDESTAFTQVDAVIVKATEGIGFVDPCCDRFIWAAIEAGIPWGFYHFANDKDPVHEADYFIANCLDYFGKGVPVLDWETTQNVDWVNRFVNRVHERTQVWPWIYGNAWRFDQGGVEPNCMRWVARYPNVDSPPFGWAASQEAPECDGLVGAWQFCSDGALRGYAGDLDFDLFYGDTDAWSRYATGDRRDDGSTGSGDAGDTGSGVQRGEILTVENEDYKVTVEKL